MEHAEINIVQGNQGPFYNDTLQLSLEKIVITEQGTQENLPIVDFVMTDTDGRKYLLVTTGRIVNGISAAIKGINTRNHGVPEP